MTPRHQSQTERDLEGIAAKKRRETEPQGVRIPPELAAPHEVIDPVTSVIPRGPERDAARAQRPTAQRIKHLEDRADLLVDELIASRAFMRTFLLKVLGIVSLVVAAYYYGKNGG